MRTIVHCLGARPVQFVVVGLLATIVTPSFAAPPTDADEVACIEQIIPPDARLADIADIKGKDIENRLKDNPVTLLAGDQIVIRRPGAVVMMRTLATNEPIAVTFTMTQAKKAYTVLPPGRYRLTLTDAQNVKEQEDNLFVVAEAPAEPRELRDANLPEESRQLYTATWLAVQDRGTWAFEAQQRVAAMDCRSAAVEDWLRQWGSSTPCADAKR